MSRILRSERGTTNRARIMRSMAQALRAAAEPEDSSGAEERDIPAFLALGLAELQDSVTETTSAWERRAYWVKADRFRQQWEWVPRNLARLEASLDQADLIQAGACGVEVAAALADLKIRPGKAKAKPWKGAWRAWSETRQFTFLPASTRSSGRCRWKPLRLLPSYRWRAEGCYEWRLAKDRRPQHPRCMRVAPPRVRLASNAGRGNNGGVRGA